MENIMKFLPSKMADQLAFTVQLHTGLAGQGVAPADYGLTPEDVTLLGTQLTADQANFNAIDAAKLAKQAATAARSGVTGTHRVLMATVRDIANKMRVSGATDEALAQFGLTRRDPVPSPRILTTDAPEFTLESVKLGIVNVRFRETGSASPRARAANSKGVRVAVVNATNGTANNETDNAPTVQLTRNPAKLDSTGWPAKVRLYACWVNDRGATSAWSAPLTVNVL